MKYIYFFALLALLNSCKSKEEKLRDKITPVVRSIVMQDSLVFKLDSIKILKVANLTDSLYAERTLINKLNKYDHFIKMISYQDDEIQILIDEVKSKQRQVALYSDYESFATLRKIELDEIKDKIQEMKDKVKEGEAYRDSINLYKKETTELADRLKQKKFNTKNFRGYYVLFNLTGSDKKNLEIRRDSLNVYISPSFHIIPINQM